MSIRNVLIIPLVLTLSALACSFNVPDPDADINPYNPENQLDPEESAEQIGTVTRVVDGDTIEVQIGEVGYRVRYVGVNTPERDEVCYSDATAANAALVEGQTVRLVRDTSSVDRYGRLLRYVYVGDTFVNEQLVRNGWAEAVEYQPDTRHTGAFRDLEVTARSNNAGCHPTGIFNDGSDTR